MCSFLNAAGIPTDDRNWPPFFPIIHHDIANEIPVHAQKLQYLAFASWLGICVFSFTITLMLEWVESFLFFIDVMLYRFLS